MVQTRRASRATRQGKLCCGAGRIEFRSRFVGGNMGLGQNTRTSSTMRTRTKAAKKMQCSPPPPSPPGAAGNSGNAAASRRPVRPMDRQKMLDWLLDKLNKQEMPKSLHWVEEGRVFSVRWPHAARHGYCKEEDAQLYKAYAKHTGLYKEGDVNADHKKWKANFRCALHSLHNVKKISNKDGQKGPNASRLYEILEKPEPRRKTKSRKHCREESSPERKGEDSDSGVSVTVENPDSLPVPVSSLLETPISDDANIPDFKSLGLTTCIQQNHLSGGCVTVMAPASSPSSSCPPITPLFSTQFFPTSLPAATSTSASSSVAVSSFSSSSSSQLSFPTPTTTTTELPEELVKDMIPVGIMIRDRTPSGDSGVPGSPPVAGDTEAAAMEEEFLELDEGIGKEILDEVGANIDVCEVVCSSASPYESSIMWSQVGNYLDISRNMPVVTTGGSAVALSTGADDVFMYTCLSQQNTISMETE